MKINSIQPYHFSFKGAQMSITAFSDTHGQLEDIGSFWEEIEKNKDDIFLKEGKGKKDVVAVAGDWFMAGNVKGYKSNPDYNSQKYQLLFFNKLMKMFSRMSKSITSIFTIGNHELDAGFEEFSKCVRKLNSQIVSTNVDLESSDVLKRHALRSKTIEIQDDKDPSLVHKVLFLGVSPGNMSYYNKKLEGIKFLDDVYKPQSKITPDEVKNSINAVKKEIEEFKKENPKGAVVLLDHFGGTFQDELLRQKLPVNVILSAHEHLDYDELKGSALIVKLFQNFKKFENVKINFDDNGDLSGIKTHAYYPKGLSGTNEMQDFYERVFKKDIEQSYSIPARDGICDLELKGVRYKNSYLANYITDVILNRIQKRIPETDFFALNASAIRGPLKTKEGGEVNNINILLTLNGIRNEDANIMLSRVTGREILYMIAENVMSNAQSREKNPLNHYSGLSYNKTMLIKGIQMGLDEKNLISFIRDKNGEPLDLDREYLLANVEKFFLKSKNPFIKELYTSNRTAMTLLNAKEEFKKHFEENLNEVSASKEIRVS